MGIMSDIKIMEDEYYDREDIRTNTREKLIKLILEIDAKLGEYKYSDLFLRQYDNDQLNGIATNLKIKLKKVAAEISEESLRR